MELTMTTAINTNAKSERELTEDELNHVSGGRGRAEVNHSEFTIVKLVDAATPKLF
jgi:bacteriocin-like protein